MRMSERATGGCAGAHAIVSHIRRIESRCRLGTTLISGHKWDVVSRGVKKRCAIQCN